METRWGGWQIPRMNYTRLKAQHVPDLSPDRFAQLVVLPLWQDAPELDGGTLAVAVEGAAHGGFSVNMSRGQVHEGVMHDADCLLRLTAHAFKALITGRLSHQLIERGDAQCLGDPLVLQRFALRLEHAARGGVA